MAKIAKIHLIHTTSTNSDAGTDGSIYLNLIAGGTTHRLPTLDLGFDERERGNSEHYRIDVLSLNLDDDQAITCRLETTSTDGWLPKSVFVLSYNVNGQCKLLAAEPNWPSSQWLDKPSYLFRTVPGNKITTAEGTLSEIRVFQTTSTRGDADSDGSSFYLDIVQDGKKFSGLMDLPSNDDFLKGRTEEYIFNVASKSYRSRPDLDLELRATTTDGWLPNDVFVFGIHTDGKVKLLEAVPSWSRTGWVDSPGTPVRNIVSPYPDTDWRAATVIDQKVYYNIKPVYDNWQVGVENENYLPGDAVLNQDEADGANQWRFKKVGSSYLIIDRLSGKALKSNGISGGKLTTVYANEASTASYFIPQRQADGRWKILWAGNSSYGIAVKGSPKFKAELTLSTAEDVFDLIPVRQYLNPEGQANVASYSIAPSESFIIETFGALGSELAGSAFPGGGTLFSVVFGQIFGDGPDLNDLFRKFRAELMKEIDQKFANTARQEAMNVMETLEIEFMTSYIGFRRINITDPTALLNISTEALDIGNDTHLECQRILPPRDEDDDVIVNATNVALMRAILPVYVMGSCQAVVALQEAALVAALKVESPSTPPANYATVPFLDRLEDVANTSLFYIEQMFPPVLADRLSRVKMEFVQEPDPSNFTTFISRYVGTDTMIGKRYAELSNSTSSSYRNAVRDNYKESLTFSYTNYLYRIYDAALKLAQIHADTVVLCDKIRNNTDGARDQFITDAQNTFSY